MFEEPARAAAATARALMAQAAARRWSVERPLEQRIDPDRIGIKRAERRRLDRDRPPVRAQLIFEGAFDRLPEGVRREWLRRDRVMLTAGSSSLRMSGAGSTATVRQSAPSSSATTCASVVAIPWPCSACGPPARGRAPGMAAS
jgi:hypothetical protein